METDETNTPMIDETDLIQVIEPEPLPAILPCPNCDSDDHDDGRISEKDKPGHIILNPAYVYCFNCKMNGPHALTQVEAINAWNAMPRRTTPPIPDEIPVPQSKDDITLEVFARLQEMRFNHFNASEALTQAKYDLEYELMIARRYGLINGKNETERNDQARQLLTTQFEVVRQAEAAERKARFDLEQAQADVDCIKLRVRLSEVEAGYGMLRF